MVDYAAKLAKNGEDQKALKVLLQVETNLGDELQFLRVMVEMQKKLGNTELVIAYLTKAAQQSTVDGDYGSFQEIIGDVMQLDMLVAGDLIQRYSNRFKVSNAN